MYKKSSQNVGKLLPASNSIFSQISSVRVELKHLQACKDSKILPMHCALGRMSFGKTRWESREEDLESRTQAPSADRQRGCKMTGTGGGSGLEYVPSVTMKTRCEHGGLRGHMSRWFRWVSIQKNAWKTFDRPVGPPGEKSECIEN